MFSPFLLQPRSQRLCFSLKHGTFGDLWHRILAQALVCDAYIFLLPKSRKPLCGRRCRPLWTESRGVYDPDSFSCLIFDPSKMPESCLTSHRVSPFQSCLQIARNGRLSFWSGVFLAYRLSSAHRRSVGDTRALRGGYLFSFSVVVVPGFCSMGFLLDRKFWHYPKERFTLLQKTCHVVEIACPGSVLTVSLNLFHQTEGWEIFNGRVNGFPIHTALLCNDSPRGKAGAILAVAVPKQTAVHGEVSWLQF